MWKLKDNFRITELRRKELPLNDCLFLRFPTKSMGKTCQFMEIVPKRLFVMTG